MHEDGEIDSSALYMIKQDPALISVMTANNEVGTIEPIDAIAKECKRKGVLFHTDAVQAFGKIPIDVKKTPIDFMSISGHKIGAPKGIGALYIREGTRIEPLIDGGHQENGMRGGTENVAAIVGFGAACEVAKANMEKESERLTSLSEYLISNALSDIKGIHLTGSRHTRIPGHCSFVVDGVEGEVLQMLMDMAGEVDEQQLMAPYPAVLRAVNTEKKSIEELQKQTLSTKKRANEELKSIPHQIEAQDRLKVDADFNAVRTRYVELGRDIDDADRLLEGSNEELEATKLHREKVQTLRNELDKALRSWREERDKNYEAASKAVSAAQCEFDNVEKEKQEHVDNLVKKVVILKEKEEAFNAKKIKWQEVNSKTYTAENLTVCPTCGHVFTEQEKIEKGNTAIEHFNKEKAETLQQLLSEATALKEQINVLTGTYNEDKQIIGPQIEKRVEAKKSALDEAVKHLNEIKAQSTEEDEGIKLLRKKLSDAESEVTMPVSDSSKEEIRAKKMELTKKRDELMKILAGEDTNMRIEEEKERLNMRAKELAQIVADCDNTLYQIMEYKKSKINAIEDKINDKFQIARWRFFEKNITDDNYCEVCKCLHNGIDYNSTNAADRINLGVDIVSSIGKAYSIEAVVWVDNSESIADIIKIQNQIITLKHIPYSELKLEIV